MSTRSTATHASNTANDLATSAGETISAAAGQVQAAAQDQYDKLTAAVRRNPLEAAAIAAGVGFLVALVARR